MKKVWILMIVALVALVSCAGAETLTGNLGTDSFNQTTYLIGPTGTSVLNFKYLSVKGIEYTTGLETIVRFDYWAGTPSAAFGSSKTPVGNTTLIYGNISGSADVVCRGTMGYMRNFLPNGTETLGYQYIWFSEWNNAGLSGDKQIDLYQVGNATVGLDGLWGYSWSNHGGQATNFTAGGVTFGANIGEGNYYRSTTLPFSNTYSATKPSGIGITGFVDKTGGQSLARLYNADTGALLSGEYTVNANQFNFSTVAGSIIIGVDDSGGNHYNSSILFSSTTPTPTPTPTPTGTPVTPDNPIPYGYVRSMAQCVDGQSSGTIHECQISLKDVENGTWSNGTYYGTWWIDTLPTHTIDAYGSATGYSSVSRTGLPASGTKMYELLMWPSYIPAPTAGSVNFYVIVNDAASGLALPTASVRVVDSSTGITHVRQTGTNGVGSFVVTNSTLMHVTVSKTGYIDATATMTTTAAGPDTLRVELLKAVVTTAPTNTIPPGGVTTAVTVDSRTSEQKATGAMNILYDNGEEIVGVCVLVTILGLLGVRLGK